MKASARTTCATVFALGIVVVLAGLLTLWRLGAADVCGFNEAVEGVIAQRMVEHHELLFPHLNGITPMYKPPLFHWTATMIDRIVGWPRVTAFNLRLPAALYAIAGVILTMIVAYQLLGGWGAILSGLILCGSYQYIEQARIGRVDMTLCFFESLVLFSFVWWSGAQYRNHQRFFHHLLAIALGLAVLAKGPIGAFLPGAAIGIFLLSEKRFGELRAIFAPGPVVVAILLGSSWYLACLVGGHNAFLDRQIGSENFGRFFGALGTMWPGYYIKPILLNSGALSFLIPFAVYFAIADYSRILRRHADGEPPPTSPWSGGGMRETRRREGEASVSALDEGKAPLSAFDEERAPLSAFDDVLHEEPSAPSKEDRMERSGWAAPVIRLFAIFWIVTVIFFTIAAYKRRSYLLPLWPSSAIVLAWFVQKIRNTASGPKNPKGFITRFRTLLPRLIQPAMLLICAGSIVFNLVYLPRKEMRDCTGDSLRGAAEQINRIVGRDEPLYGYKLGDEPAALLFYLDRDVPPIAGRLGDAPPGYVIAPAAVWDREQDAALDLTPVFESSTGRPHLVLLRHGRALAALDAAPAAYFFDSRAKR